jgi:hypothetical protein
MMAFAQLVHIAIGLSGGLGLAEVWAEPENPINGCCQADAVTC